jgi:hypothetical protein
MVMNTGGLPDEMHALASEIFDKALPHAKNLTHMRAKALSIKSLSIIYPSHKNQDILLKIIYKHSDSLIELYNESRGDEWDWFDDYLGYNNAVLPESLFHAGVVTGNKHYIEVAEKTLEFLISKTFTSNVYSPIGNEAWHTQNETRSEFDQQPEDPASMVLALVAALQTTHNEEYKNLADLCFSWFLGNNVHKIPLYNELNGGCFDGLHPDRMNLNQGAESLVSYLLARIAIDSTDGKENENSKNKGIIPEYSRL